MQEKKTDAIQYMSAHRWQTLRSIYMRFVVIWVGVTVRVNEIWPMMDSSTKIAFAANAVFVLLGWAGLWAMFRQRHPYAWPFFAYLAFYPVIYYITHATLRYRNTIDPVLAVLATYGVFCATRALARQFAGARIQASAAAPQTSPASD